MNIPEQAVDAFIEASPKRVPIPRSSTRARLEAAAPIIVNSVLDGLEDKVNAQMCDDPDVTGCTRVICPCPGLFRARHAIDLSREENSSP